MARSSQHTIKRSSGWPAGLFAALVGLGASLWRSLYLGITSFRKSQYKGDVEYCRDLPDLSPAAAATDGGCHERVLLDISVQARPRTPTNWPIGQMSATVMSLASKGAIAIYPGPADLYDGIDLTTTNAASVAGRLGSDAATARKTEEDQHHRSSCRWRAMTSVRCC